MGALRISSSMSLQVQASSLPRGLLVALGMGLLVVVGLVALSTSPESDTADTADTQLSNDQGGISTNGRVDLNIQGCAGFNCQKRFICIDRYKRCTDNWCTVNCNHGPSFCPKSY